MIVFHFLPTVFASLLLAAHFFRMENLVAAGFALVPLGLVFVRRPWALRVIQVLLALGALEWLRTAFMLVQERLAVGGPVLRLGLVMFAVFALTLAGAWYLQYRWARVHFRLDAGNGSGARA